MNPAREGGPAERAPAGLDAGLQASGLSIAVNVGLAVVKTTAGLVGRSYALVADGIESTADVISSLIVWGGLRLSAKPPDPRHPYGHGKAESMAAVLVSLSLVAAAGLIAAQSVRAIRAPGPAPAWYTLVVLLGVMAVKESMYRYVLRVGDRLGSTALRTAAWHHRSDAVTSLAAFLGISVALFGGPRFAAADAWAALVASAVILFNGLRLLRPAVDEVMDAAAPEDLVAQVRRIAAGVPEVADIEKCRVRKSGVRLHMDIHVLVNGETTVREGHRIGHEVKDRLLASPLPIEDVVVHIEPAGEPAHRA